MNDRFVGIDACKRGWIGVVWDGRDASAHFAGRITDLVAQIAVAGQPTVIAVDMPIGLADTGLRQADVLARAALGPRRSSLFVAPVRAAVDAATLSDAIRRNRELAGVGISAQAFGLCAKIREVDEWVRHVAYRVVEVHPELSFAAMGGAPLPHAKTTWAGAQRRRALLTAAGLDLPGEQGAAGAAAGVDDMLDAAAAAWSARRVGTGQAICRPDPPDVFSDRLPCAIWS